MSNIKLPSVPKVEPCGELRLNDVELPFFDGIAAEHVRITGTPLDYYALNREKSKNDPLYNEAEDRVYDGPFRISGFIEYPENAPEVRDEGVRFVWNSLCWLPRRALEEANCPIPNEGDVVVAWQTPFMKDWSTGFQTNVPGAQYAFDCVNVNDDGHLFDNASFVGYRIELRRRTEFTPERRIDGLSRR